MEGPLPSLDELQAVFILYCAVGRSQRVVLGSTDGLYGVRLQSAKDIDTMSQKGFEIMARDMPGLMAHPRGAAAPLPYIFTSNVGVTKIAMSPGGASRKSERFELRFDHWLDALKALATHVYAKDLAARAGPGVDVGDVALATFLQRHMRPLLARRFLGTDQVGPDPTIDSSQAAALGVSPSYVSDAWDWARANGIVGRPLSTRLVLTEDSVKTDVEAWVMGLRGVALAFKEARDTEKFAMRLKARLTSFSAAEQGQGGGSAAGGAGSPRDWTAMARAGGAGGDEAGAYARGGASVAASSVQLSLSRSLARDMAPSTYERVQALNSISSATAGDGGFAPGPAGQGGSDAAIRLLGPATAAAIAAGAGAGSTRPGSSLSRPASMYSMPLPSAGHASAAGSPYGQAQEGFGEGQGQGQLRRTQSSYSGVGAGSGSGWAAGGTGYGAPQAQPSIAPARQVLPSLASLPSAASLQSADAATVAEVSELVTRLQLLLGGGGGGGAGAAAGQGAA